MPPFSHLDYVNQSPGLTMVKDLQSKIIACSQEFSDLLGFSEHKKAIGSYDYDLPCDAKHGLENFRYQDLQAIENGEHIAIDIYRYANNEIKMIYHKKSRLVVNSQPIGLSFTGFDLSFGHKLSEKIFNLISNDRHYLKIDTLKSLSYNFQNTYPNFALNKKESLCLYYLLRGKSNQEISNRLHLSCRTIEGKISEIRGKMGCKTRQQLIELCIEKGYLNIILKDLLNQTNLSINLS